MGGDRDRAAETGCQRLVQDLLLLAQLGQPASSPRDRDRTIQAREILERAIARVPRIGAAAPVRLTL